MKKTIIIALILIVAFVSGCTDNQTIPTQTELSDPISTDNNDESDDQLKTMQATIADLQATTAELQATTAKLQTNFDRLGLPTPSTKQLIPTETPFKIELHFDAKFRMPYTYLFEGTMVEIDDEWWKMERSGYEIDYENNTIYFKSEKYDFYDIVLSADLATLLDRGWIVGIYDYKIIQHYDDVRMKYYV